MDIGLRWLIAIAGLPLAAVTPLLWWWAPGLLFLACPVVLAWGLFLVVQYLTWARTLGKR